MRLTTRALIFAVSLLFFGTRLHAADVPRIANVQAEIVDRHVVASAELLSGFQPDTLRDLHNGIPKEFYYYVVLNRKYKNWIDEEVYEKTIRHTVRYDTLKKQYTVVKQDFGQRTEEVYDDFEAVRQAVSRIARSVLLPVDRLRPDHRYYLGVKAQMKVAKLPVYLEYFLFFIPVLEMDTPWAYSDVIQGIP